MIRSGLILLICQLVGTVLNRALHLPLPGPVIGLVLLLSLMGLRPRLAEELRQTVTGLLGILSLLFVPAGVGVVQHMGRFAQEGLGLMVALVVSTALAILVAALAFSVVARLVGTEDSTENSAGGSIGEPGS